MLKISRLETRFQEIVFLLTVVLALSIAVGGIFYLTLIPANFLSVAGTSGTFLISKGFANFGYTYFFFVIFALHMGHLILAHSLSFRDLIRMRMVFIRSFLVYFSVLIIISSVLTVVESYSSWKYAHNMIFGVGGWFGVQVGGFLFAKLGLYGALVLLGTVASVIGIAAGFMEIVHSFYVMKEIFSEVKTKITKKGPKKIKDISNMLVDFIDQPPADYALANAGAAIPLPPEPDKPATSGQYMVYRKTLQDKEEQIKKMVEEVKESAAAIEEIKEEVEEAVTTSTNRKVKKVAKKIIEDKENKVEADDKQESENEDVEVKEPKKSKAKSTRAKKSAKQDIDGEEAESAPESDASDDGFKVTIKPWKKRYVKLDTSILEPAEKRKLSSKKEIEEVSGILKERLESFGVKGEIIGAHQGVTLTMFEFKPNAGMKVSKIQSLSDDMALVLGAKAIRILTPIPGKTTVGIEVPNLELNMLRFSELVPTMLKRKTQDLPIVIGQDVYNNTQVSDLAKMPHLLVSGTTGSGKSVFMNNLISGLLVHKSPKQLRFLMIDPKMIELSPYNGIPHLLKPVVTDVIEAKNLLIWAEKEMDRRYQIFSDIQAKNIKTFNAAIKKTSKRAIEGKLNKKIDWSLEEMPFIVIVIDELADLMLTQRDEVERPITRIAQKARAAGIHLVVATQRPSADIVTGLIKTNFPTRVSFKVSSGIDSRTILDTAGAEKLLGNGDMLYLAQGKTLERLQGSFLSEDEVKKVVRLTIQNNKPVEKKTEE